MNNKCVIAKCNGKVVPEYSESQTNDTMKYLQGLFNIDKYFNENKLSEKKHAHLEKYYRLQSSIDEVLDRSKYNKVDLGGLFKFMVAKS